VIIDFAILAYIYTMNFTGSVLLIVYNRINFVNEGDFYFGCLLILFEYDCISLVLKNLDLTSPVLKDISDYEIYFVLFKGFLDLLF
jgi:hypothetical protein